MKLTCWLAWDSSVGAWAVAPGWPARVVTAATAGAVFGVTVDSRLDFGLTVEPETGCAASRLAFTAVTLRVAVDFAVAAAGLVDFFDVDFSAMFGISVSMVQLQVNDESFRVSAPP